MLIYYVGYLIYYLQLGNSSIDQFIKPSNDEENKSKKHRLSSAVTRRELQVLQFWCDTGVHAWSLWTRLLDFEFRV